MVAISIHSVSKRFPAPAGGQTTAVDEVTLEIPTGSLFFLLGPSGCGKTTLLRMIAGFARPSRGRILFDQQDITALPPHLRDTGMVFQSYALWPHMTVAENVAFGLDVRKVRGPDRTRRIDEALSLVQMDAFKQHKPNQLSGGQQQRVALARALAIRPRCLLLDEPLSNLDAKLRLDMRSEIRRIVKLIGITAVYVTHDQKEALSMADTIAVLRAGRLEQVGAPTDLYHHPRTRFVADFIGESNFLDGIVQTAAAGTVAVQTAAGVVTAAAPADHAPPPLRPGQKVCLAFRPEAVTVLPANSDRSATASAASPMAPGIVNHLPGRLLSTTYLGEMAEHLVELLPPQPGAKPIKAFEINPRTSNDSATAAPVPRAVDIAVPAEHIMLLDTTPSRS